MSTRFDTIVPQEWAVVAVRPPRRGEHYIPTAGERFGRDPLDMVLRATGPDSSYPDHRVVIVEPVKIPYQAPRHITKLREPEPEEIAELFAKSIADSVLNRIRRGFADTEGDED